MKLAHAVFGGRTLYPSLYAWYVLAGTLDLLTTWIILHYLGGSEVNKLADALIQRYGVPGMVALKYSSIIVVVMVCEFVGRARFRLGYAIAVLAVIVSALPVGIGLLQVWIWTHQ